MSIKLFPVFKKKKADKRRQGTLPVFCIPSSSLWASLMCLPQSLFWLPPAVSFSPLHWRGFWLTKIKHELLEPHVSAGDPKRRALPALYTHQGCKKLHQQCKYHPKDIWSCINCAMSRCAAALVQITILLWTVKADPESVLRGCSPPSRLLLVINVCTDITPYFKGLLTQQRVDSFQHASFTNKDYHLQLSCMWEGSIKSPFTLFSFIFSFNLLHTNRLLK